MNARRNPRFPPILIASAGLTLLSLAGTEQYWNPAGTGGDGIWGTGPGDKNWNPAPGAPTGNTLWPNSLDDIAVFQDTLGGIVTVFDPVDTAGIIQDGADYTINAGTITLVPDADGNAPFIEVESGILTIDSEIDGSNGLIKNGSGTLALAGFNTYTGPTELRHGDLVLLGELASEMVTIASRTVLVDELGGLGDHATISNRGGLILNSMDTVDTYIQTGGLDGPFSLTTINGATLERGSVAGTLLGDTTVTGMVQITGRTGDGTLTIDGDGYLYGDGTFDNAVVDVQDGNLKILGNNIADTSTLEVQADGNVQLIGNDTVDTTTIAGRLYGTGTLTASSYTLRDGAVIDAHLGEGTFIKGDDGTVTINGTLASDSIAVPDGTLVLSGDNLEDTAEVTVNGPGILELNGDDTVGSYTSTGGTLSGSGILLATNGATLGNESTVSGTLDADITTTGDVLLSGTLAGRRIDVVSGTLTVTGRAFNNYIVIEPGATVIGRGQVGIVDVISRTDISNSGTLSVEVDNSLMEYIQEPGGILNGGGILSADGSELMGGEIAGHLMSDIRTTGDVLVSGLIGGGSLTVDSGTLTMTGMSTNTPVTILDGAILIDNGDLLDTADFTNAGMLETNVADTIGTYVSNGGTLGGSGTLTANNGATLHGGSTISGNLVGNVVTTGDVLVSGVIGRALTDTDRERLRSLREGDTNTSPPARRTSRGVAEQWAQTEPGAAAEWLRGLSGSPAADDSGLHVTSGTLTVTGTVFSNPVTIEPDARILDQGPVAFGGTNNLTNHGVLVLDGSETVATYHSSATGTLQLKVTGPSALDHLNANTVTLESGSRLVLERTELLLGQVADIIDGAIDGTFSAIEALSGAGKELRYGFNPNDGSIQALPGSPTPTPEPGTTLFNLTANQTQVVGTVFDATHLGVKPNFRRLYFRDTGDPDPARRWREISPAQARPGDTYLLDLDPGLGRAPVVPGTQAARLGDAIAAFQSSYTLANDPAGQPVPVVSAPGLAIANSLSPESHHGMADFTRHAMRSQMRTAMRTTPGAAAGNGHVFGAFHTSSAGSSAPIDDASYGINADGGVAGMRFQLSPDLQVGGMIGTIHGDIKGTSIDTEASGFMLGVFGEYLVDSASHTTVFASLGFGSYSYDATRRSFGGPVYANNIDSTAIELALGIETVAWQTERFRIIPRGAFRYLDGDVSSFRETGPGVQMMVDKIDATSLLFELGVDTEFDLNERTVLRSHLGVLTDLLGSGERVSGSYLGGGAPLGVTAPGIDAEAIILGLGASFDVNDSSRVDLNWRSEFRDDSQHTHLLSLGGRVTF